MAGYTSRIFFSLSIPSVFGFLSVLWFLKRRKSNQQINRAIQVEEIPSSDDLVIAFDSMKLKDKEGDPCINVSCSEMQLKETQTSESQSSKDAIHLPNSKVKGKKITTKLCENSTVCAKEILTSGKDNDSGGVDKEIELAANGIEVITLNQDVSAKDQILLHAINEKNMEISDGTNCVEKATMVNGDYGTDVQKKDNLTHNSSAFEIMSNRDTKSAKKKCDTDDRNIKSCTVDEKKSQVVSLQLSQNNTSEPLTLPVDCPDTGGDMLESPGAKYCDSVGSNDSGKGGSEFQFLLEAQQIYMVYEFEILQELCGLLIGRNGRHVRYIKEESNADILIKRHPCFPNKKVCSITGTEDEIHAALKLIRKRFPVEIYPTVTLSQINSLPFELQLPETLKLCLPEGVSFEAMLCATVNAGHFFLQQPTHPTFHSLPALTTQMTALYTQLETPKLSHLSAGYVCAASLTDGWYRAEIDEVFESTEECRLKFLDYGGYAIVARQNLRQIRYDFMNVPFQATECYLGSVTFLEGEADWSHEATAAFEELAQGQIVQGYIVGYAENRVPYVHLYKITGATSMFINRELVSQGMARWLTAPF